MILTDIVFIFYVFQSVDLTIKNKNKHRKKNSKTKCICHATTFFEKIAFIFLEKSEAEDFFFILFLKILNT